MKGNSEMKIIIMVIAIPNTAVHESRLRLKGIYARVGTVRAMGSMVEQVGWYLTAGVRYLREASPTSIANSTTIYLQR